MSFPLSRHLASRRNITRFNLRSVASRKLTLSSVRSLKETDRHNPNQADENERHKQDQLAKQKEGKGHWKPELASVSEEAVNADRQHKGDTIEALQEKTAKHAEEKHKSGTSQHDGFGN